MKIRKAFCLFEQSGTWKNEFRKLGIEAEDYDIRNDFGETDHVVDLFAEIEKAYDREPSLFDEIGPEDLAVAFFPCTRFEAQVSMWFNGNHHSAASWPDEKKLEYAMRLHDELHTLYALCCKLFVISNRGVVAAHCGKPGERPALSYALLPDKARRRGSRPHGKRGLFQKANTVLVCKLRPGAKYVFRAA